MLTRDGKYREFRKINEITLTASEDGERSGLRRSTGVVTEQQSKACTSGDGNNPGTRGTSDIVPRIESGGGRVVTRVNALHTRDVVGQLSEIRDLNGKPTKKKGPRNRAVNITSILQGDSVSRTHQRCLEDPK